MQTAMAAYPSRAPDIVKSVRQRWLYNYWGRLRGGRTLPLWSDLDMAELDSCFDDLTILDVLSESGAMRFRIYNHGKNVGAMYAGQCAGKYLEETLPHAARASTLETYEHAARTKLPVYTVSTVTDAEYRTVLFERLLLPFSDFGHNVFRIIGFLESISPEGAFERRDLMIEPRTASEFTVKAVLKDRTQATPV